VRLEPLGDVKLHASAKLHVGGLGVSKGSGAGEVNWLDQAAGAVGSMLPGSQPFLEKARAMFAEHFRVLGKSYLNKLRECAPNALRIVDKMTGNLMLLGVIQLALPNATIIHAVRDPVDTCVSCFSLLFVDQPQTYDLAELGRYYRRYRELMTHWRDVLSPARTIEVHYEDLVSDLEGVGRRIVAHCGLPWDPRCLEFYRNPRPVRTPSAAQVRQPIYKTSIGRSRKFEKFLEPLLAELGG
jgi:hypothetical protein